MAENTENTKQSDDYEYLKTSDTSEKLDNSNESKQFELYENSNNSEDGSQGAEAVERRLPLLARLVAVFTAPSRLAASVKEKPDFIIPLIISTVITLLYTWASLPAIRQMLMADPQLAQIPEDQLAMVFKIQGITTLVGGVFGTIIAALIGALVVHLVAKMLKGKGRFVHAFSIIAYSTLIGALGAVVRLIMYFAIPGADFLRMQTSLAVAMPDAPITDPVYLLLAQLDLFSLWSLVFVGIGMSVCYGLSRKQGYLVAFIPWGLYVAATTIITALFA
jgi:uncharacterized membrane protein YeaQ/YmgE (transglycosylase-associated protein family)